MCCCAFAAEAFEEEAFEIATRVPKLFTSDEQYWIPLKPRVEIYDPTGEELLLMYDAFDPDDNDIVLLECNVQLGLSQTNFLLRFEDGSGAIDQNTIGLGNKVLIYAGRDSGSVTLIFTGYSSQRSPEILGDGVMNYVMEGYSEMASLNDILVNFKRASSSLEIDDPNLATRPDSQMEVHELVRDLFEDVDVRVTRDFTLQDYLGLDLSGIDPLVTERLLSISQNLTEASQVMSFLAEVTGAVWRIDNGRLIFEYPDIRHTGITIKNKASEFDLASRTSYFTGPWKYTDSISKDDGFANRIYTATAIETKSVANNTVIKGATTLYNRALATQFTALESRINTLFLIMSKIGNPFPQEGIEIQNQVVKGEIRIDNGNNEPIGPTICSFEAPVSGLTSSPDTVFINDLKIDASVLSPSAKYWIVLFPIGTSPGNTIRWHHNNDLSTPDVYSGFAMGKSKTTTTDWKIFSFGPQYCFTVFARIRRLQEYSDPQSIAKFRVKEDHIEMPFLDDSTSVAKLMQNILAYRGKPVRKYDVGEVTLPLDTYFIPGQYITVQDDTGHHEESRNVFAEIHEVNYNWSTDSSDKTIGTFKTSILPIGFLNWHSELFPVED